MTGGFCFICWQLIISKYTIVCLGIFKIKWLGSRKENCLFSLSWVMDKRASGKTGPSLRVSEQGRKSDEKSMEQKLNQACQVLERTGLFLGSQGSLCRAAVSQEVDFAHQKKDVLWANLREMVTLHNGKEEFLPNSTLFVHFNPKILFLYVVKRPVL